MNRRILQLAIPSIVSNITVPLLGLVDVTIVGHLGSAAYIGAIAVGGLLFNILYWNFGFLRMGTSGLTSQAYGRKDADAEVKVLVQAVSVGLISAAAILILQYPVERLAFYLLDTSPEVEQYAVTYFRVLYWRCMVSRDGLSECRIPVSPCISLSRSISSILSVASVLCSSWA